MKFGKVLQQSQQVSFTTWENFWVDYKLLKRIIKDCAQIQKEEKLDGAKLIKTKIKPSAKEDNDSIRTSPDEENFFRTLRSEIKKIGDFFIKEQAAYLGRMKEIEEQYVQTKANAQPETKTALMKSCVTLYKELLLLENFAVMNFCGISKILKKHDKWTGYATRNKFMRTILMKQPFATYMPLLQMINRLEQIFMETTGNSIDQHDSSRRQRGGVPHPTSGSPTNSQTQHTQSQSRSGDPLATASGSPERSGYDPSPPDGNVTLGRVHALRDDARHFRQIEGVADSYDGDDSGDSADDATLQGGNSPLNSTQAPTNNVVVAVPMTTRSSEDFTSSATKEIGIRKDYSSDSDAAALAMLSMKEAAAVAGLRSGSDSEGGSRFKRKACSSLTSVEPNGKRKMSVATILN